MQETILSGKTFPWYEPSYSSSSPCPESDSLDPFVADAHTIRFWASFISPWHIFGLEWMVINFISWYLTGPAFECKFIRQRLTAIELQKSLMRSSSKSQSTPRLWRRCRERRPKLQVNKRLQVLSLLVCSPSCSFSHILSGTMNHSDHIKRKRVAQL